VTTLNRRTFQKLAENRLLDAGALLRARRYDAAYYMAGYVIECALKACIAKKTRRYDFPPRDTRSLYRHDMDGLVRAAGISEAFEQDRQGDTVLDQYWELVKDWSPDSRYQFGGAIAPTVAKTLFRAIEDHQHGVLKCISKYW
jgi:HEPN domain-containing protein